MALVISPPNHRSHTFSALTPTTPRTLVGPILKRCILKRIKLSVTYTTSLQSRIRYVIKCQSSEDSQALVQRLDNVANANLGSVEQEGGLGTIVVSNEAVRRRRKWNSMDVATAGVILAIHFLSVFAPFVFNWSAFWLAMALYAVTGLLGITLSYHRNLSHKSFKLPKWLEYSFAYCGVQALQGNPTDWVSTHRYHHQFCDSERDPHTPMRGFWHSHMNWLFDHNSVTEKCGKPNNVGDLEKQPFYRFISKTYILHPVALGALLYALGGFPFLVWGMGVRIVWVYHITWLVNSACHVWGKQAWNTGDLSRNNWWVGLLAFGEGWHNNHHAFEYSARHGLEWWQIDMTWYVVRFLQALGLATDVKLPTELHKQRMAFNNSTLLT
ncbi:palmitoyl-monogalactosyldiacylglycerol delta-7 desaturase, chloroplastic-like [Vitis riparia]|uniref:palmitoyl-monogalactosyldiacylglycerol delta-7 desaturase, chloroplastic-like n=1 Tax=Vitis riparia TaxID=96939 RepID=UPI00155B2B0C|nr:palmitoyl-monogalactosyldiacylglycerol delta-7 desaturase, chloroplastic-like [Vitis riparia]